MTLTQNRAVFLPGFVFGIGDRDRGPKAMNKAAVVLLPGIYIGGVLLSVGFEYLSFQTAGGEAFAWADALSFAFYWPFRIV